MTSQRTFKDVVCCGCGLVCDDVEVVTDERSILTVRNACVIGEQRFKICGSKSRYLTPLLRNEKGEMREVSLSEAFKKAADILLEAEYPLLYGWSSTTCEAQRLGIQLAKRVDGVIDGSFSISYEQMLTAIGESGLFTCTLGQVKNRANLIIFWGCNPMNSHPRLLSRCAPFPVGFFNQGRTDRKIIVIDVRETETTKLADRFIRVKPSRDSEFITALRLALRNEKIPEIVAGVSGKEIYSLAEEIKKVYFGVVFFGTGLIASSGIHLNVEKLLSLASDLNETTKFVVVEMRGHFNESGFTLTLLRETGYPFGVDFNNETPRCCPGETTATDILARGLCDAALIVASDPMSSLPWYAARHLTKIPLVVVDPHWTPTTELADVVIPVAISGIEAEGTAYRMDGVPFHLRKVIDPPENCLPDEVILKRMLKEVEERI